MANFNDIMVGSCTDTSYGEVRILVETDGCIRAITAEEFAMCIVARYIDS